MIDHEKHLRSILETQQSLSGEISELNSILTSKKEQYTKLQGIVEYLTSNGVKPEKNEKTELPEK